MGFSKSTNLNCGKCVGGTTQINAMLYVCGTDADYNSYATLTGDPSWSYTNMVPFMIKHQNMKDTSLTTGQCASYHGTSGPLSVSNSGLFADDLIPYLRAAAQESNYKEIVDFNCGPDVGWNGFVNVRQTINAGRRDSAGSAFISRLKGVSNFYMVRNAHASSVIISKNNPTNTPLVTGVNVVTDETKCPKISFQATREVILSAGALNTPKILLASGIGRATDLQKCNTPQILDLNVGNNFQDHVYSIHFFTVPGSINKIWNSVSFATYLIDQAVQYSTSFTGYFSFISSIHYQGYVNTLDPNSKQPEVQWTPYRFDQNTPEMQTIFEKHFGYTPEIATQIANANKEFSVIQVFNTVLNPKSKGSVKLRSCTDPRDPPIINANYFSDPADMDTTVRGYNALKQFFNSPTMKSLGVKELKLNISECNPLPENSDAYARCYIKYITASEWHVTGTAKMGSLTDPNAVVDSNFRVIGVKRGTSTTRTNPMLRVVDASIFPNVPSCNTMCPTYTIAEKAADVILKDNP